MPFGIGGGKKDRPLVYEVNPRLPGPWQYLSIVRMLRTMDYKFRDLPLVAYPVVALVVWRTMQRERKEQRAALLGAEREAIRRSQRVYIAKSKRKRFLFL